MMRLLADAFVLAATAGWAETGKVGPPKSELKDGPFFVSWRYVTPSSGMVYATPKLKSKEPPQFTAGEPFELSVTIRVPPGTENPCRLRPETDGPCSMRAVMYLAGEDGKERVHGTWTQTYVLRDGLATFQLEGRLPTDIPETKGHIDFQVLQRGGSAINGNNTYPFRIKRP